MLREIEGFGYEEIAEMLNVHLGTVKSRLMRGRAALREALREDADAAKSFGISQGRACAAGDTMKWPGKISKRSCIARRGVLR